MVLSAALVRLEERVAGVLLRPGDPGYDGARRVWNGSIDRRPALIVRPANDTDVALSVDFAASHGLPLAVRGGGHSVAGHGTCEGGLVIDLGRLRDVRIDHATATARVGGGARWGDLDAEATRFGLATTGGQISTTGVGGLTLGGGVGWLVRRHGLSCDNLQAAVMITAEGERLTVSADEHPDLYWAIRGGGGNFGVATSFTFRLHPVSTVLAGSLLYSIDAGPAVFEFLSDFAGDIPEELTLMAGVWTPLGPRSLPAKSSGRPCIGLMVCYAGPLDEGARVLRPVRTFGKPLLDDIGPMAYPALQRVLDPGARPNLENCAKAGYLNAVDNAVVDAVLEAATTIGSPLSQVTMLRLGGAFGRVAPGETAVTHRSAPWLINILATWEDPVETERHVAWVRRLWASVQSATTGGVYVNFLGEEGAARVRAAYDHPTYDRLSQLKRRYDPANLFRINQNITPASGG